jgi:hypothetical protein
MWFAQVVTSTFLAVLFLQSGLDKLLDWSRNKHDFFTFLGESSLKRFAAVLLGVVTMMEMATGIFSAAGAISVFLAQSTGLAWVGACLAALTMLTLFFGQRLRRDYAGAASSVPYFLASVVAVVVLGAR